MYGTLEMAETMDLDPHQVYLTLFVDFFQAHCELEYEDLSALTTHPGLDRVS